MDTNRLRSLAGFEALSTPALRTVAARTRWLKVPARRWLVRPGRALSDHYYLLEGRVRLLQGGRSRVVEAASRPTREPVYPGAAGLETLSPALFASIHPGVLAALAGGRAEPLGVVQLDHADGSWQRRFLSSPLLQRLGPLSWQRLLRAMTRQTFAVGETIVRAGALADCCYVLCSGAAEIRSPDGSMRLARVQPGGLFGEDALVTGAVRNASVVMVQSGQAVSLPADSFQRGLLEAVVRPLERLDDRRPLTLSPDPSGVVPSVCVADLRAGLARLPRSRRYAVLGGTRRERWLASFLLAERGVDARPVMTDELGPMSWDR
ncbi:MAG: cyclic nucleotide-binding domain-containing protein [Pseudomonadales bacterium]